MSRSLWLVGLGGCVPSLSASTAYRDGVWMCDDPAAYDGEVESCGEVDGCAGITSLSGTIEGSPFVLTAPLYQGIVRKTAIDAELDRLDLTGTGPYFGFSLIAKSLGGALDGTASERSLQYGWDAETLPDDLDDETVTVDLRVGIPLRSVTLGAHPGSGSWTVETQTRERVVLSFDGVFGATGDEIRGCATVLPTEVRVE